MPPLLVWFVLAAAVEAPITDVTVYSDRARVVRTAALPGAGAQTIELPTLPQAVDPNSIRVEAVAGEVKRVELSRLEDDALPADEARRLIAALQQTDDELAKVRGEGQALNAQVASLNRISPATAESDPLKPRPKLSSTGWSAAMGFVADALQRAQTRQRALSAQEQTLAQKRTELAARAQSLGATQRRHGWKVVAQVAGGTPTLKMTYFVQQARWYPLYDLALNGDTGKVTVAFSGLVSQESGEDWSEAALTLSTSVPATATTLPKLLTWKIGERERFIPTPSPVQDAVRPPPPAPPLPTPEREQDRLRGMLLRVAGGYPAQLSPPQPVTGGEFDFESESIEGELARPDDGRMKKSEMSKGDRPRPRPAPARQAESPPPSAPSALAETPGSYAETVTVSESQRGYFGSASPAPAPTFGFSLAPPPGPRPPSFAADLPAAAAGGYDLNYLSLQRETVQSGKGARKVALFSEAWPVKVERKLFPALFPEAFLVAELKNPSAQPLPAGTANLYVGDDPAGTARLKLVSPGEAFTLPLGIDRALRPVRNVKLVQSEHGVFSKEELTQYVVTLELANPYRAPVAVRLLDQLPVTSQKEVEIKLVESKPVAIHDTRTGALEWRFNVPANQKTIVSFTYSVRRPKGWLLQQSEVNP